MRYQKPSIIIFITVAMFFGFFSVAMENYGPPSENSPNLTVAVIPSGGANVYASLVLARLFVSEFKKIDGRTFHSDIFSQTWGAGQGSLVAAWLTMTSSSNDLIQPLLEKAMQTTFPWDLIDEEKFRQKNFEKVLSPYFGGRTFNYTPNDKMVFVGSAEFQPMVFCPPKVAGDWLLHCQEDTKITDALMACCCRKQSERQAESYSFSPLRFKLLPNQEEQFIFDFIYCGPKDGKRFIRANNDPTPLVLEYVKTKPGTHTIVVFGNGGKVDDEFRNSLNVENNIAVIKSENCTINVFFIDVDVPNFEDHLYDATKSYFNELEKRASKVFVDQNEKSYRAAIRAMNALSAIKI